MAAKERCINLFTGYGFKKIFGEEPNKNLLLDFLSELLREEQGKTQDMFLLSALDESDTEYYSQLIDM